VIKYYDVLFVCDVYVILDYEVYTRVDSCIG
jgi:hypothetical protein